MLIKGQTNIERPAELSKSRTREETAINHTSSHLVALAC